jgi:hypothetical protein
MPSARYRALAQRVRQLERRLLPKTFSPVGAYSDRQLDLARGYRLLAHAEIEAYIEDMVRWCANESLRCFQADRKPRTVAMSVLAFHMNQQGVSIKQMREKYATGAHHVQDVVKQATTAFNHAISLNHGIREPNVLQLLLPIGLLPGEIDPTWLGTTDSFGAKRGQTAHTSFRAQQQPDPGTESSTVSQILAGLAQLDEKITKLR